MSKDLKSLITHAMIAAMREYRDVPEMADGMAYSGTSVRETWLIDRATNLMLSAIEVYSQTAEAKRKVDATQALKLAAEQFAQRFPDEPKRWPDNLFNELTTVHEALGKAKEADL